jgi:hypothetical protein
MFLLLLSAVAVVVEIHSMVVWIAILLVLAQYLAEAEIEIDHL